MCDYVCMHISFGPDNVDGRSVCGLLFKLPVSNAVNYTTKIITGQSIYFSASESTELWRYINLSIIIIIIIIQ